MFESKLFKQFGQVHCLSDVMADLIALEEDGIEIKTAEGIQEVHFVLALVLGDNLGLNNILGFAGSFMANFFLSFLQNAP